MIVVVVVLVVLILIVLTLHRAAVDLGNVLLWAVTMMALLMLSRE